MDFLRFNPVDVGWHIGEGIDVDYEGFFGSFAGWEKPGKYSAIEEAG